MNKKLKEIWFNSMGFQKTAINMLTAFVFSKNKRRGLRKKLLAKVKKQYLSQYLYALDKNIDGDDKIKKQSNKIWVCWLQGEENAPNVVKACIKSIRKYKPSNMEVVVITNENIRQYANIPEYIYEKKAKGQITNTQFSDILRLSLLTIHGGIWIDATVLLTSKIPQDIANSEYFAFHSVEHGMGNNTWFLVSEPDFFFIKSIRNLMFEYWKNEDKMLDYFQYHLFVDLLIEKNEKFANQWKNIPLYWDYDCYDFGDRLLLQKYNEKTFNEVIKKTPIHKLKYKYDQNANIEDTFLEKILEK